MVPPVRDQDIPQEVLDAAARKYVFRVARRYSPLFIGLGVVLLIITLVPSISHNQAQFNAGLGAPATGSNVQAGPGGATGGAAPAPGTGSGTPVGGSSGASGASGSLVGQGTSTGAGATVVGPGQPGSLQEASGVSKTGVKCGTGVRQFAWSAYAPLCVPAFKGSNPGTTAPGASANTITLTFRQAASSADAAALAYAQGANAGSEAQYIADMQTYINFFNTQYETYGRKVVLKPYNGQGDPLQEDQGQNLQGAQADAASAHDLGAFADMSLPLGSSTQPYADDLAQQHIMSFGAVYSGRAEVQKYAPYIYSALFPDGDTANLGYIAIMCKRMAGLPAVFAGDPTLQAQTRKFGLILPDRPGSKISQGEFEAGLKGCGIKFEKEAFYTLDVSQMPAQSTSILAQMKAAGVSTIMCGCDPVFDAIMSQSAEQQKYQPEYLTVWWSDSFAQLANQSQWSHSISNGGTTPDLSKTEAYRAFKLASPKATPQERYYSVPYLMLSEVFSAIQAAGPNLNPTTFAQGYFSLPGGNGDFGPFGFSTGKYNPTVAFKVGSYSATAVSSYNGSKGAYQDCNSSTFYYYNNLAPLGPDHTQLHCNGR